MLYLLLLVFFLLSAYYCLRFYLMKKSVREMEAELREIQKDLKQNHVLHLPMPDKDLEALVSAVNDALDRIREEGRNYERRAHGFQSQIEAVSHDLRTPLTVILGYLNLFKKQEGMDMEERREMLDSVTRKAQDMKKLIAQFYDYSRLYAGDYELTIERVDAGRILREAFVSHCVILETAHLRVDTKFPDHPVWVKGDKDALLRIFTNLLSNASRYAKYFFGIMLKEEEGQVQIIFENDTDQISEKEIPYLFERFYKNDHARSGTGSGLGLSIANSLAKEMGGTLKACLTGSNDIWEKRDDGCVRIRFILCLEPDIRLA